MAAERQTALQSPKPPGRKVRASIDPVGLGLDESDQSSLAVSPSSPINIYTGRPIGSWRQTHIGPIPEYPEMGANSWRSSNDDLFINTANAYNSKYNLYPGDQDYLSADLIKAWAMVESGGDQKAFTTDPLQVGNPGDWTDEKIKIAGLTNRNESMSPALSARAALRWLRYKGNNSQGIFQGTDNALYNYSGNTNVDPYSWGMEHRQWCPIRIHSLAFGASHMQSTGANPPR
jgi:hypothetical protein